MLYALGSDWAFGAGSGACVGACVLLAGGRGERRGGVLRLVSNPPPHRDPPPPSPPDPSARGHFKTCPHAMEARREEQALSLHGAPGSEAVQNGGAGAVAQGSGAATPKAEDDRRPVSDLDVEDHGLAVTKVAGFAEAAAIVTDALSQRDTNYAPDETALWARSIYFSRPWDAACVVVVVLNLALILFESPNREAEAASAYARGFGGGGGGGGGGSGSGLTNSTIPLLPLGPGDSLSLVLEFFCTLVYVADTSLQFLYLGRDAFFHSKWVCLKLLLLPLVLMANGRESFHGRLHSIPLACSSSSTNECCYLLTFISLTLSCLVLPCLVLSCLLFSSLPPSPPSLLDSICPQPYRVSPFTARATALLHRALPQRSQDLLLDHPNRPERDFHRRAARLSRRRLWHVCIRAVCGGLGERRGTC